MIHHLFTIKAHGWNAEEHSATDSASAIFIYACGIGSCFGSGDPATDSLQLTCAVWKDGVWHGYYRANVGPALRVIEHIATPQCFEPLPCPKVTPVKAPDHTATPAETFKACPVADREVAIMALKTRAASLGIEAEAHRDIGSDALADIVTGQQTAVLAALDVLRELHKEAGND